MSSSHQRNVVSLISVLAILAVLAPAQTVYAEKPPLAVGGFSLPGLDEFVDGIISNVSVESSSSGGVVSGEAVSTGNSDAQATVRNIIRGSGRGVQVSIDVETESDGSARRTSVSRFISANERVEIDVATSAENASARARVSAGADSSTAFSVIGDESQGLEVLHSTTTSSWRDLFRRFKNALSSMVEHFFSRELQE